MSEQMIIGEAIADKATFKWELKNFSEIFRTSEVSKKIESPKFKVLINDRVTEWTLVLYPKGSVKSSAKCSSLLVKCCSEIDTYVNMIFNFKSQKCIMNKNRQVIFDYNIFRQCTLMGAIYLNQEIVLGAKDASLFTGNLTIEWEIILDKTREYEEKMKNGKVEEFNDFKMLFKNEKLSDFTFLIKDANNSQHKLHAHKYILAKKSNVFAAMFRHDTLDNRNNHVHLEDISLNTMIHVLRYIYCGQIFFRDVSINFRVNSDFTQILDVLKVADKYALDGLKKECEDKVYSDLELENAIEVLAVADQCSATLKNKAMKLIVENIELLKKSEFNNLTKLRQEIVVEVFQNIASEVENLKCHNSSLEVRPRARRVTKRCRYYSDSDEITLS